MVKLDHSFLGELADLGRKDGFESLPYTVGSGACLRHCLYLACEDILLSHLELKTAVLLHRLIHASEWVG